MIIDDKYMALTLGFGNFYGIDSLVEFLIILVSFFISYYSYKIYKIIDEKNYKFLSLGFLLIGVSFIFKILSNLTIMYRVAIERANFIYVIWTQFQYAEMIQFFSFIFFKTFHLIGFLILFLIVSKTDKKEKVLLFLYLSIIVVLFSIYFNFVFHMTLIFLIMSLTMHFYENYKKIKSKNSLLVFTAFLIMLLSHVLFVISDFNPLFYLVGEMGLLVGFLCLLTNQIYLRNKQKNGNKKNQVRDNKRYAAGFAKKQKS